MNEEQMVEIFEKLNELARDKRQNKIHLKIAIVCAARGAGDPLGREYCIQDEGFCGVRSGYSKMVGDFSKVTCKRCIKKFKSSEFGSSYKPHPWKKWQYVTAKEVKKVMKTTPVKIVDTNFK